MQNIIQLFFFKKKGNSAAHGNVTTWMDLGDILNKTSQTADKGRCCVIYL